MTDVLLPDRIYALLLKLAHVADRYDGNELDEHRPAWGHRDPEAVELVSSRGGATLLTLADMQAARQVVREMGPIVNDIRRLQPVAKPKTSRSIDV